MNHRVGNAQINKYIECGDKWLEKHGNDELTLVFMSQSKHLPTRRAGIILMLRAITQEGIDALAVETLTDLAKKIQLTEKDNFCLHVLGLILVGDEQVGEVVEQVLSNG